MKSESNGYVLYSGESSLDGQAIVVIATGFRRDSKTEKQETQ